MKQNTQWINRDIYPFKSEYLKNPCWKFTLRG